MSAILENLLKPQIQTALQKFGSAQYSGPVNPAAAQQQFVDELSKAIAKAIQQYLLGNVTVIPGQVVLTVGGPTNQAGTTSSPGKLNAP